MKLSLNGRWALSYRLEKDENALWQTIPAQVPGNVELDLYAAGVEKEPLYDEHVYDYRKYEFYEWRFERDIEVPSDFSGDRILLEMEGVNTYADVYVNGEWAGETDNMLIQHDLDVTSLVRAGETNRFIVHIHSACNIARDMDYPAMVCGCENGDEYVWQRKPPSSFGWDIMPRFPSAGLWRGISLVTRSNTRIREAYYATRSATERRAEVVFKYRFDTDAAMLDNFSVRVSGEGFHAERKALFTSGEGSFVLENPRLWWPRGYGEANLYEIKMELLHDGEVVDTRVERIGVRVLEVEHVMKAGDEGEFLIRCNGCPILAKGSNWVPLDAMHSRDAERYDRALALFYEAGCNIVRCWGGNVYEDARFFDLCDEMGIMVWQDFAMACALYPQDPELYAMIELEAASVIRKFRNHPCILLWAGDNEVDEGYEGHAYRPVENRYNALTREVLPRMVRMHDPYRMFLPSSPYITPDIARYEVPEQHNWGARAYFKDDFYKQTKAHFISECGYHGCPAPESLAKYIPQDKLWPYTNTSWATHNTEYLLGGRRGYDRNQLMADQVDILFGFVPDNLAEFALLSQVSQAEAKKFFIERTRLKKWRRTGIIWWNMLDGWPQISDAVVDYYFVKKRAFRYIKRVQKPICLMMDELRDWTHAVVLGNDSNETRTVSYVVRDGDTGETLLTGEILSPANENVTVDQIRVLAGQQRLFLLEWTVDGISYANHYITGYPPYDAAKMKKWLEIIDKLPD